MKKLDKRKLKAEWGSLTDSKDLFRDVSNIGKLGNGDYEAAIKSDEHFEYIVSLVKDVIKIVFGE